MNKMENHNEANITTLKRMMKEGVWCGKMQICEETASRAIEKFGLEGLVNLLNNFRLALTSLDKLKNSKNTIKSSPVVPENRVFLAFYSKFKLYVRSLDDDFPDIYQFCAHCNKWEFLLAIFFSRNTVASIMGMNGYLQVHCCCSEGPAGRLGPLDYRDLPAFMERMQEMTEAYMMGYFMQKYLYMERKPVLLLREVASGRIGEAFAVWNVMKNTALYLA